MGKRKTLYVVEPNYCIAGCRLRWHYLLESSKLNAQYRVKTLTLTGNLNIFLNCAKFQKLYSAANRKLRLDHKISFLKILIAATRAQVFVFGKPYHPQHMMAMRIVSRMGKYIISDFCDFHSSINPAFIEAAKLSEAIVCPTKALAARINRETSREVQVIEDRLDPVIRFNDINSYRVDIQNERPINILWFGLAFGRDKPTDSFRIFSEIITKSFSSLHDKSLKINIISEDPAAVKDYLTQSTPETAAYTESHQWSCETMTKTLSNQGLAIVTYPEPVDCCEKSANRLELALYSGKEVYVNGILPAVDLGLIPFLKLIKDGLLKVVGLEAHHAGKVDKLTMIRSIIDRKQIVIKQKWESLICNYLR